MPSLISSIRGTLEASGADWVDISLGHVTFRVNVPADVTERLGEAGEDVRLFTSVQVRDDNIALYGFSSEGARSAFETLIGVNGVGPRVALNVLSRLTPSLLVEAVAAGDMDAFGAIPGIGKKTASRIVLELKGKLDLGWAPPAPSGGDAEVIEALSALGYTHIEAREAVSALPADSEATLEDRVRLALHRIGGGQP